MNINYRQEIPTIIFCLLLLSGIVLNTYIFVLPYDKYADENDYLTQVLSLAEGKPEGWNLRSFFYPSLLVPSAWCAKIFFNEDIAIQIFFIRCLNWICCWITLFVIYKIGERLFSSTTAKISAVLLLFHWPWILSSRRILLDAPAAMWLALSIWFTAVNSKYSDKHTILATIFASLAVFTKFQMGPATIGIAVALLLQGIKSDKIVRTFIIMLLTTFLMLGAFAIIDTATWGKPFSSLLNFINYNFDNSEEFQHYYGDYPPATFYLQKVFGFYDRLFPFFIFIGLVVTIYSFQATNTILLPLLFYIIGIQFVSWKNARYLLPVVPLLTLIGAYGINIFIKYMQKILQLKGGANKKHVLILNIFSLLLIITIIGSFVPWHTVSSKLSKTNTCSSFVYDEVLNYLPKGSNVILFGSCSVPRYILNKHHLNSRKIDTGNLRSLIMVEKPLENIQGNKNISKKGYDNLLKAFYGYEFAIVIKDDNYDKLLQVVYKEKPDIVLESQSGEFLIYKLPIIH